MYDDNYACGTAEWTRRSRQSRTTKYPTPSKPVPLDQSSKKEGKNARQVWQGKKEGIELGRPMIF